LVEDGNDGNAATVCYIHVATIIASSIMLIRAHYSAACVVVWTCSAHAIVRRRALSMPRNYTIICPSRWCLYCSERSLSHAFKVSSSCIGLHCRCKECRMKRAGRKQRLCRRRRCCHTVTLTSRTLFKDSTWGCGNGTVHDIAFQGATGIITNNQPVERCVLCFIGSRRPLLLCYRLYV
jgi:hypothetical protein